MAAAAGKKSTASLSLFMETFGLEVEEELSTLATQYRAEGVWKGKWHHEQREAWMRQKTRSALMEAGKRTCRSSGVRDP